MGDGVPVPMLVGPAKLPLLGSREVLDWAHAALGIKIPPPDSLPAASCQLQYLA